MDEEVSAILKEAYSKDFLGEEWAISEITALIGMKLRARDRFVKETIEGTRKSLSDTLSEDSAYYGYCDYCKDHASEHGNENNRCGCDFFNQALDDLLTTLFPNHER